MRQFIVIEAGDAPKPDDHLYRAMLVRGSTCNEAGLLDMANRMRQSRHESAELVATVPEAVETVKRGGWVVLEILAGEAKTAEPAPHRNSWQDDSQDWADG